MANEKLTKKELELLEKAKEGMNNAFAFMTKFPTGSTVLTDRRNIYHAGNVETTISGMGSCSERAAIYHAVAHGEYCFKAILITTQNEEPVKPCGMCLQQIGEFAQVANHDIEIIMVGSKGKVSRSSVYKMLPDAWGPRAFGADLSKYEKK